LSNFKSHINKVLEPEHNIFHRFLNTCVLPCETHKFKNCSLNSWWQRCAELLW